MSHVYMIVFWFHRICICTQITIRLTEEMRSDVKRNEKDVLLKILVKKCSIFFKY
jgi:hypothetical protein